MPAVQDRLHDVGGEKRHAQDAADIGSVDLLCRGRLLDDPVGAGLKQLAPPEDPFNADGWTARVFIVRWSRSSLPSRQDLVLTKQDKSGEPVMTRPMCKYPAWPRYKGTGDVNAARCR